METRRRLGLLIWRLIRVCGSVVLYTRGSSSKIQNDKRRNPSTQRDEDDDDDDDDASAARRAAR